MINEKYAKSFCCEELSLIENYDIAVADTTQTWDCHHRRGTIYTRDDLKKIGEYYNRPAIELIFLTSSEHHSLHNKGKKFTEDHKRKIGDALRGKIIPEEQRKHQSEVLKGRKLSEEHKNSIREAMQDESVRAKISAANKGRKYTVEQRENLKRALANMPEDRKMQMRKKMSDSHKGKPSPNKGKKLSDEQKQKLSKLAKCAYWWNNGIINKRSKDCPGPEWKRGMFINKHKGKK